jgi:hypothetical protein
MPPELPIVGAAALVGLWLAFFFLGATAGGLIHLMPIAAIALAVRAARGRRMRHDDVSKSGEEQP